MRKKFLILGFLFIVLVMTSACSSQSKPNLQSVPKEEDLLILANNISLKTGTNFSGDTVLESEDFSGFNYKYNESPKEYIFTFKLTDEGQEKMADATTKLAETSGDLSLWIGDELITSSKVMEPVTGDAFAVYMVDVNEGNISNFVAKLEGRQQTPDVLPGIDDWNKEIVSDKSDKTHVRYYVLKEDGNEETVLDVYAMTEEHDLDEDGLNEIVVYLPGEEKNIGI
ncbi:MAG TPA: hypothetical protein VEA58_04650, partial [Anaerovoracaceae bacterium]|nr:hypothetical protein [Anaerovoracaceae bacterium]